MINDLKYIKNKIKKVLEDVPLLRDNDNKLIATIWWKELPKDRRKKMTAFEILLDLAEGRLPSAESIRRSRQKIQEQNPELRGKTYKDRKNLEKKVRTQINKI